MGTRQGGALPSRACFRGAVLGCKEERADTSEVVDPFTAMKLRYSWGGDRVYCRRIGVIWPLACMFHPKRL